jgi:hypothetical protein
MLPVDPVAVMVVSGRIVAVLNLPVGILFWDLFAHRCKLVPAVTAHGEQLDVEQLRDSDGVKILELAEFLFKVATEVSPEA